MLRCLRSLLNEKTEKEIWAYLQVGEERVPVQHWESLIGKARSADLRLFGEGISRIHARGGDFEVTFNATPDSYVDICLTGPVSYNFKGVFSILNS